MAGNNTSEIIFEDLHGLQDEGTAIVDLDKEDRDDHGIERRPAQVADDDPNKRDDGGEEDEEEDDDDPDRAGLDDDDEDDDPDRLAADDDGGDDDDPDREERYSRKVRARIQRATKATAKERERADYWKRQAEELAKETVETRKAGAKQVIDRATKEIESVEGQIEAAMEAGNTKEQVKLISRLTDLKAEKIQAEVELQNVNADTGLREPDSGRVRTSGDSRPRVPEKAQAWMEKRSDWYGARGFERQTRLANRIDKEVFADGYDPATDEYYKELDRRIKRVEPDLFDKPRRRTRDRDNGDGRKRRSPVAGVDGGADSRRSTRSGKVELTGDDFANMRRFGLDTNDPQVLREYARNKRESDSGARR